MNNNYAYRFDVVWVGPTVPPGAIAICKKCGYAEKLQDLVVYHIPVCQRGWDLPTEPDKNLLSYMKGKLK